MLRGISNGEVRQTEWSGAWRSENRMAGVLQKKPLDLTAQGLFVRLDCQAASIFARLCSTLDR